jgi:phosphodiesterase/alkaline phosphatase D-like protein
VARLTGATADARLRVRAATGGNDLWFTPSSTTNDTGILRFNIAGLEPATIYNYQVVPGAEDTADGSGASGTTPVGRFRTTAEGPHSAVVLFGSCASTGSNAAIWDTMRASGADLIVHMGDLHYDNITQNDAARFHAAFDKCLTSPRQGAFFRQVPIAYVWDDHDFGGDESNRHSRSAEAAQAAYRTCVPHYPLSATSSIQQAFSIGRVRFLVTDERSARDGVDEAAPRSMLGSVQLQWLLDELEAASRTSALVVWANSVPWITKNDESTHHGWAPYAEERRIIADRIEALGLTRRLIMISGDAHMVAIDDGTNSRYGEGTGPGFVVAHGAAFDRFRRNKGGPYSVGARAGRGQFGELRIQDSGDRIEATITCRDSRGRQIRGLSIRVTYVSRAYEVSVPGRPAVHAGVA